MREGVAGAWKGPKCRAEAGPGRWPGGSGVWALVLGLATAGVAGYLLLTGAARGEKLSCLLGTCGLAVVVAWGIESGRCWRETSVSLVVDAPVGRVFGQFARYTTWPDIIPGLRQVEDLGGGRSRWLATGPLGAALRWDVALTRVWPEALIAWRGESGPQAAHQGEVRFERLGEGRTRITLSLAYRQDGGAAGAIEGAVREGMRRLKRRCEQGGRDLAA